MKLAYEFKLPVFINHILKQETMSNVLHTKITHKKRVIGLPSLLSTNSGPICISLPVIG
jgi:hypothetical protein